MNQAPLTTEYDDIQRITQRTSQAYVRGTRELDFFRLADSSLEAAWAPCSTLFIDRLLDVDTAKKDTVVVNFDASLFTEANWKDHPLRRFRSFAEAQGLEVRSLINGRPDLNPQLLDIFPMIDMDEQYLGPLVPLAGSPAPFTEAYNSMLEVHPGTAARYTRCRFAFGKRLHGWLPFHAFDIPAAFIGVPGRRGFPRDYFETDDFLCDVPHENPSGSGQLNLMADMMIEKLRFFISGEDRLTKHVADRRAELWERLQQQSAEFAEVLKNPENTTPRTRSGNGQARPVDTPDRAPEAQASRTLPDSDADGRVNIVAFCESANQIKLADAAAREWHSWARIIGASYSNLFQLDPDAILAASHLSDFIHLDRHRSGTFPEKMVQKATADWLESHFALDSAMAVISFNDGSRLAKHFVSTATQLGIPCFVIQDGFLGHETNVTATSFPEFQSVHAELLSGTRSLQDSVSDPSLRELYVTHAATTKIGATSHCTYFVRGEDVKIKMCMLHGVLPRQVHVVGSVHAGLEPQVRPEDSPTNLSDRDRRILYIGQCHTLHGKIGELPWLDIAGQIFAELGSLNGAHVSYKFHPSETPRMRGLLEQRIPESVRVIDGDVLVQRDYADYDLVVTEYSTAVLDAVAVGTKGVVIDIPALPERLPRVLPPAAVHYSSINSLRTDIEAALSGIGNVTIQGAKLEHLEHPPSSTLFIDIGLTIRNELLLRETDAGDHTIADWRLERRPTRDIALDITRSMDAPLYEARHRPSHGRLYFAQLRDRQVLYTRLKKLKLSAFVPALRALLGATWAEEFASEAAMLSDLHMAPEVAAIGRALSELSQQEFDALMTTARPPRLVGLGIRQARAVACHHMDFDERVAAFLLPDAWLATDAPVHAARLVADRGDTAHVLEAVRQFCDAVSTVSVADEQAYGLLDGLRTLAKPTSEVPIEAVAAEVLMLWYGSDSTPATGYLQRLASIPRFEPQRFGQAVRTLVNDKSRGDIGEYFTSLASQVPIEPDDISALAELIEELSTQPVRSRQDSNDAATTASNRATNTEVWGGNR